MIAWLMAGGCAPPAYTSRVPPQYPKDIRPSKDGQTLIASVRVVVAADGSVTAAQIDDTTGVPELDSAAVDAVKQWKFTPVGSECASANTTIVQLGFPQIPVPTGYASCSHAAFVLKAAIPNTDAEAFNGKGDPEALVDVALDANGDVQKARIERSSFNSAIDKAALDAATRSHYAPKMVNCTPVPGDFTFSLMANP